MKSLFSFTKKLAVVAFGFACMSQAVHADTLDDIKARKAIRIAVDLGTPPFGYTDEKLKPQGSDYETAQKIAKDLGVELQIVEVTGPNRIPFLMTKKADIVVSSFSITPERMKAVQFSKPYGALDFVVAAPQNSSIKELKDLEGKRVGVVRGNIQDLRLTPIAPKGTTIVRFDDDATTATALLSGQVDAICTPSIVSNALAKQNPGKNLENKFSISATAYAVGLRKEETALADWINQWIDTNRKNGELAAIYKKWIGTDMPDLTQFD
jgi:polar amino acid transport system substrate-binding protein